MPYATVISICPFETREEKPIARGIFIIPAAPKDDFIVLHISDSSYIQRLAATDMNINIPVAAHLIAKSIVDDFVYTTIESSSEAGPGMMWVDGRVSKEEVSARYTKELDALEKKQIQWFKNLCRKADDDWEQFHQRGLISDHQRYAADYLGYNPDWRVNYHANQGFMDCPACFTQIDSRAVVCVHCKAVLDKAKAISFGIIADNTAKMQVAAKG